MVHNSEHHDDLSSSLPPFIQIDEAYWSALLEEHPDTARTRPVSPSNGNGSHKPDANLAPIHNAADEPAFEEHDWDAARAVQAGDETIELAVTGYNSGGLLVTWKSLRGFVPASQLVNFPVDIDEARRRDLLARRTGQTLTLRIIELNVENRRLVLSERAAQVKPGQRESILHSLQAGTTCDAVITNLCDFGAFADLGGIEGLIHISELSWGRVNHPRDVVSSGQQVKVYIMTVDPKAERVALSMKRLQPDPWQSIDQRFKVGELIEVTITNIVDFGAFACVEEGLEGLIHISQLAEGQFLHPHSVVQEGEKVKARILNIDGKARRLGLSLRQAQTSEGDSA
jgi:small subunit ribosomal protein S1